MTREEPGSGEPASMRVAGRGPALCEIILDPLQPMSPKLSWRRLPDGRVVSSPPENMAPFLPRAEFLDNTLLPAVEAG